MYDFISFISVPLLALNTLDTISNAFSPETLIIAIPPSPIGVAIAHIVSNSLINYPPSKEVSSIIISTLS